LPEGHQAQRRRVVSVKYLTCDQGSNQWLLARLGRPTASNMSNIVTSTGKACTGQTRATFMCQLLGERITGLTTEHHTSAAMERGVALEPVARDWYEMQTGNDVQEVGFAYSKGGRWGASPDGLVGDDGGIEIKCPTLPNMIKHLLSDGVPSHWRVQIQACLWICERTWWDFVMYTDARNVPSIIIRVERDDKVIAALGEHVPAFCDELDAKEAALRERYGIPVPESMAIEDASGDIRSPF